MELKILNKAKDVGSFNYLHRYGGIEFLDEFYDIEHCENPILTLDTLQHICKRSGG